MSPSVWCAVLLVSTSCYRITVTLSASAATIRLPFSLDGGYVGGLDLGQSEHFDVRRGEGALPEIVMEIETYDGEERPLPEAWKAQYGISTHHIALSFPGGKVHARDLPGPKGR